MAEWQKCPVCDGAGLVSRPPYRAGDIEIGNSSGVAPCPCKRCAGTGTIRRPEDEEAR